MRPPKPKAVFAAVLMFAVAVYIMLPTATIGNPLHVTAAVDASSGGTATSGKLFSGKPVRKWQGTASPGIEHVKWNNMFAETIDCDAEHPFVAVVTTISPAPTTAILELASQRPDITVIVIADKKSPTAWNNIPSNIQYVSVEEQTRLYSMQFMPPWNHFGRKNVGYLEALKSGACFMWDFDDDNILLNTTDGVLNMANLHRWARTTMEAAASNEPNAISSVWVNLMPIMGNSRFIWPRGSPLEPLQQNTTFLPTLKALTPCKEMKNAHAGCVAIGPQCSCLGLLSTLAQGNPDLDAIQRLTTSSDVDFKRELGSFVALGERTTASHNAQATLISRAAIILGMLPMTVHGRVSDIWRSVIFNRLSELYGLRVAVTSGTVEHIRNPHSFLGDLDAEQPLYAQANVLGSILFTWEPTDKASVGLTIWELYVFLFEVGVVEAADVVFAEQWVLAAAAAAQDSANRPARQLRNTAPDTSMAFGAASQRRLPPSLRNTGTLGLAAAVRVTAADVEGIPSWIAVYAHLFTRVVFLLSGATECHVHSLPVAWGATVICDTGDSGHSVLAGAGGNRAGTVLAGAGGNRAGTGLWPGALVELHTSDTKAAWIIVGLNFALDVGQLRDQLRQFPAAQGSSVSVRAPAQGKLKAAGSSFILSGDDKYSAQLAASVSSALATSTRVQSGLAKCPGAAVPLTSDLLAIIPGSKLLDIAAASRDLQYAGAAADVAVAIVLYCDSRVVQPALYDTKRLLSAAGLWQHQSSVNRQLQAT